MLSDHEFKAGYEKPEDDISQFYRQCFRESVVYDRVAGFFSSTVFTLLWSEIIAFADRGGKMRLVCSDRIYQHDNSAIDRGLAARDDDHLAEILSAEYKDLQSHQDLNVSTAATALAGLVCEGVLNIRFANLTEGTAISNVRMLHDKNGVFVDSDQNALAFSGSMNETKLGLSPDGNLESIDVFPNWLLGLEGRDLERVIRIRNKFELLWNNRVPGVRVVEFPLAIIKEMEAVNEQGSPWRETVTLLPSPSKPLLHLASTIVLREHQKLALELWKESEDRGIIEHATGAGKTITAISAILAHSEDGGHSVIIVPSKELLHQWYRELKKFCPQNQPIRKCGDGESRWKNNLHSWLRSDIPQILIAISATARSAEFMYRLKKFWKDLLIVADEVHSLGSNENSKIFSLAASKRLGLSATPQRHGDEVGTKRIFDYFKKTVHEYSIFEAISDNYLVPYQYKPKVVQLSEDEQNDWDSFTKDIGTMVAQSGSFSKAMKNERFRMLLIQRSRIGKKAQSKITVARRIISKDAESDQRWLVYCEDQDQMMELVKGLRSDRSDLRVMEYHSSLDGITRDSTLRDFTVLGGVIVAIRCLDEGIDIPNASHAMILASSQNPRQFIQRRGRVLRLPKGDVEKKFAVIYDLIVVPRRLAVDDLDRLSAAEIGRAHEFCSHAQNPESSIELLSQLGKLGLDLDKCLRYMTNGVEDD